MPDGTRLNEVLTRDARQNEVVERRCIQRSVLDDVHIAMRAFSNTTTFTVEHRLLTTGALGLLRCHYRRNKVERFDVAMKEARIGLGDQLNRLDASEMVAGFNITHKLPGPSVNA